MRVSCEGLDGLLKMECIDEREPAKSAEHASQ